VPARDPSYRPRTLQFNCPRCGEPLPPGHAGPHAKCAQADAYDRVAFCKLCGSRDGVNAKGCAGTFHAENRKNG
jgi:hypothetical protein